LVKCPGGVEFEASAAFEVELVGESEVEEYGVVVWSPHVFAIFAAHIVADSSAAVVLAEAFHEVLEVLMVEASVWW